MKFNRRSKLCSLTAAVMACTVITGGMPHLTAEAAAQYDRSSTVPVIVRVSGRAVMEQPDAAGAGADYLGTPAAKKQTEACKAVQESVQKRIRRYYPELTVGFSYCTLYNGFSCELPESLIERTEGLSGVVSVTVADDFQIPQTDSADPAGGLPVSAESGGCTGAGQVIAVIDSELDTTHPMFAPLDDSVETALSYDDVAAVIESGTLSRSPDPERAYLSSKLPYVLDYVDKDPYGGVPDANGYHGTHVCGIAAGNAYTASDGTALSGIARDAQLMFFACGKGKAMSYQAALAAFEDAVKLHADVINMSWGTVSEYYGDNPFSEAIAAADRAGIVVCNAAGNDGNGTFSAGNAALPEMPDTGRICDKAEAGSPLLVVASAENSGQAEAGMFLFGGQQIVFRPTMHSDGSIHYLSQELSAGDYACADCGTGAELELRYSGVNTKLALIRRTSGQSLAEIAQRAKNVGAAGVILIDREIPDGLDYVYCDAQIPVALVTYADGQGLLSAADPTVTITGKNVMLEYPPTVSSFSSWGVKHSLDLRPDLMGIGGRVRSAAYQGSDQTLSGTSMASPYAAGCAALLRESLGTQGDLPEGAALSAYLRTLMMNTAVPYEEDGLFVSPRRQGAGLVSPERAAAAGVLMTAADGQPKVNLYDQLGSSFSFEVTLENISDADVTFAEAALVLTTDGLMHDSSRNREVLSGQQALRCKTNLSAPVTVAAGEKAQITVEAELDPEQYEKLCKQFVNGFFIEGYFRLTGAENCPDLSMPLLGFSADWTQVPIGDAEDVMAATVFGESYSAGSVPLIEYQTILNEIRKRVPESYPKYELLDLSEFATDEERRLLENGRSDAWISPNGDSIADKIYGMKLLGNRNARADLELLDAEGNVFWSEKGAAYRDVFEFDFADQIKLADGDYTIRASAYIDYPHAVEKPQVFSCALHVDTERPLADISVSQRNKRDILTVTVSDDRQLQGIAVTGRGCGCLADQYDPEKTAADYSGDEWYYGGTQYRGEYPWATGQERDIAKDLPLILREKTDFVDYQELKWLGFRDYIQPEPDADGTFTFEYDVTDLEDYSITVLDEAYNFKEIKPVDNAAEQLIRQATSWLVLQYGCMEIRSSEILFWDVYDGSVTSYSYSARLNQLTLSSGSETKSFTVTSEYENSYQLRDNESGGEFILSPDNNYWISDMKAFHPVNEILEAIKADSAAFTGWEPQRVELGFIGGVSILTAKVFYEIEADGRTIEIVDTYNSVSLQNGHGTAVLQQRTADAPVITETRQHSVVLFDVLLTEIKPGLYHSPENECVFLFDPDGETGMILYNADENEHTGWSRDIPFRYTIDAESNIQMQWDMFAMTGKVCKAGEDGSFFIQKKDGLLSTDSYSLITFEPMTTDPDVIAQLLPKDEMKALGTEYAAAVLGSVPDPEQIVFKGCNSSGMCLMEFAVRYLYYELEIDPLTLLVNDSMGEAGDLRQPPQLPEGSLSRAELIRIASDALEAETGFTPSDAVTRVNEDGSVTVDLFSEDQGMLGTIRLDAVSGRNYNTLGDVDESGDISLEDAQRTLNAYVKSLSGHETGLTEKQMQRADINNDGRVSADDAQLILQYYVRTVLANKPTVWTQLIK